MNDHPTASYRGRGPFPVLGDWVIGCAESDRTEWLHFADYGEGHEINADVQDVFEPDYERYHDALDCRAELRRTGTGLWRFELGGDVVLSGFESDGPPLERVGEELAAFTRDEGGDVGASDDGATATDNSTLSQFV